MPDKLTAGAVPSIILRDGFSVKWYRGEGLRGGGHIAHRLAMTPEGKSQAVCGARLLCIDLGSGKVAQSHVLGVSCAKCERIAWAGHGGEERQAGAYA